MSDPLQRLLASLLLLPWVSVAHLRAEEPPKMLIRTEHFDEDPGWEEHDNRIVSGKSRTAKYDFGYSPTRVAGEAAGEIGGWVQRSSVGMWFVDHIAPKTLDDRLSASGTFAVKSLQDGGAGLLFGFLNSQQLPVEGDCNSMAMLLIFEKHGGRLSLRLHNHVNQGCGTFVTPYIPGRYRPTPIRADGTRYRWRLDYDPQANKGNGQFQFTIKTIDSAHPPDDFEGLVYTVDLPPDFKRTGATFDCFGLTNKRKAGGAVEIYFDDLEYAGKKEDFSNPKVGWEGSNNRGQFRETDNPGTHDFGYSAATSFAGGAAGEAGGSFWRNEQHFGTYADRIGPLTLDDRIEASGKVILKAGALDSDMALGFFNSASRGKSPAATNFLGVHVGGPTRKGHMFGPALSTSASERARWQPGPVLMPNHAYDWALLYDPAGHDGDGSLELTLGGEKVTLNLKPGQKKERATFDRFGLVTIPPGGNLVQLYVDDLTYTAGRATASERK